MTEVAYVRELVRYPVKSMAGVATGSAFLGWHGLAGDRRFAFRRLGDNGGFPWLTASRVPALLLYQPTGVDETSGEPLPTHVRSPSGIELPLGSAELQAEVAERLGSGVELMKFKHGIFDDACVSVISLATIGGIGREAGTDLDPRRFRANILLETRDTEPFLEDRWVGGMLVFGATSEPAIQITSRDLRCVMINIDPDTGRQDPGVMKTVVRLTGNYAGVYGTVVRTGTIHAGDVVRFIRSA